MESAPNNKHQKLIEMMEAFISGRNRSYEFVNQIEGEFVASALNDDEQFRDLQLALAMFGAGDRQADERMLAGECRYALRLLKSTSA